MKSRSATNRREQRWVRVDVSLHESKYGQTGFIIIFLFPIPNCSQGPGLGFLGLKPEPKVHGPGAQANKRRTDFMGISPYPSIVTLPETDKPYPSIPTFLKERFPKVGEKRWLARMAEGKVLDEQGTPITPDTPYTPLKRLRYFRETEEEPVIPFEEDILFQNEDLLVACKPHFLPVIPGGPYVEECLLHRLKKKTDNALLTPVNRIDRETAGIVLFSARKETRGLYQSLFMTGKVGKTYRAACRIVRPPRRREWIVENRIVKGDPWFRMKTAPGEANAVSRVRLDSIKDQTAFFTLSPVTGKKHQLRLHMSELGFGLLNDRYYPVLEPERPDDFQNPLQLIAEKVSFRDPITGTPMTFESPRRLLSPP